MVVKRIRIIPKQSDNLIHTTLAIANAIAGVNELQPTTRHHSHINNESDAVGTKCHELFCHYDILTCTCIALILSDFAKKSVIFLYFTTPTLIDTLDEFCSYVAC